MSLCASQNLQARPSGPGPLHLFERDLPTQKTTHHSPNQLNSQKKKISRAQNLFQINSQQRIYTHKQCNRQIQHLFSKCEHLKQGWPFSSACNQGTPQAKSRPHEPKNMQNSHHKLLLRRGLLLEVELSKCLVGIAHML